MEKHPDQSHIQDMTNGKRTAADADPKAVENWDNEGGAPASREQSVVEDPERSGDTNQFAKFTMRTNRNSMAVTKIEQHPDGKLLYNICVNGPERRMDFPVAIQDEGTVARNEEAVLRSALRFAENLVDSLRQRLRLQAAEMK